MANKNELPMYISTNLVQAERMLQAEYEMEYCGRTVVTPDVVCEGYKVVHQGGCHSWIPKKVFEQAYRQVDGMSFGMALEAAKMGKKIARKGWNGKGMYVFLAQEVGFHTYADITDMPEDGFDVLDCLCMRTADGNICPGWLASQTDMLADDWMLLPDCGMMSWPQAEEPEELAGKV